MTHWTDEQREAITYTGCNILVSAAAGAGKTAVLVERIIRLLCSKENPPDIDRLLVVTFTEAAAAEMRERIGAALQKEIRESGRLELTRQLLLVNGAAISTLHAFCLDVIRRYFYRLEIDPAFRVADELEAAMLQQDVLDELLDDAFSVADHCFYELAARYGGKTGDDALGKLILRLYRYCWSNPWPERWLSEASAAFLSENTDPEESLQRWLPPVRGYLRQALRQADALLNGALQLCRRPGGPLVYERVLGNELAQVNRLLEALDGPWEALREAWQGCRFDRLPPAKGADEALKEQVQTLRNGAKESLRKKESIFFTRSLGEYIHEIKELAPLVQAFADLTGQFAARYAAAKNRAGLLDFNDLEHFCLKILMSEEAEPGRLIPSAAARELRERFAYVLVDEYQDINPVQDAILTLVSRQGETLPNLFMVGDVKQSIYRFRLGEPGLFLTRYRCYPKEPGGPDRKLLLSKNFRCRDGVVTAVNFLFRQLMSAEVAEIEYDNEAELVCGAHYPDPGDDAAVPAPVEVILLERKRTEADPGEPGEPAEWDNDEEDRDALEKEGIVIAKRIAQLLEAERTRVFDKDLGCYRPATYKDIVILLRATSNRANRIADILARYNIPAYADLATGYFASTEVETMMSLLQVVDNPCQDIPLAALLRSPIVGLSAEELAAIRQAGSKNADFFACVAATAQAGIPGLSGKVARFLATLDRWRDSAGQEKLAAFIAAIYRETGYADYVGGLPDGAQRQANLRALFARARQFDRFTRQGLSRFLAFIGQLRNSGEDLGAARSLGERENVVRIMSIHKSKGLEFPVVILADLGKEFNFQDQRAEMLMHRHFGLGPVIVDLERRLRYPSLPYLALRLVAEAETRAEEMRILYVALTRAREKLILIGSVRNLAGELESWRQMLNHCERQLPAHEVARARRYLDWLGRALIRHTDWEGQAAVCGWLDGERSRFSLTVLDETYNWHSEENSRQESSPLRETILALQPIPCETCPQVREEIQKRLCYVYPHAVARVPAKLSVSELKRRFGDAGQEEEAALFAGQSWLSPAFVQGTAGPTGAELGSLYHTLLQHVDLNGPLDSSGIAGQIELLTRRGVLPAEQVRRLDPDRVAKFFVSKAGRIVLAHTGEVYREWAFTLALPAAELDLHSSEEPVVIQGIIDLLVHTPQGYVIVDYKTEQLYGDLTRLAARYALQLRYYAKAVETILGRPVCEAYLYALDAGSELRIF